MFQNYVKTTLRSMTRSKMYTLLNVSGFALGLACCLTIMLWVGWQWSFNRFNENLDSIYLLKRNEVESKAIITRPGQCGALASALKAEYPEILYVAPIKPMKNGLSASVGGRLRAFREEGVYATEDLFRMFSFPFVQGGISPNFLQPSSILLSESLAQKLFGTTQAMGKTLKLNGEAAYTVKGVFRDIPKNSTVSGEYVLPIEDFMAKNEWTKGWNNNFVPVYIQTRVPASLESTKALNDKLAPLLRRKRNDPDANVIFAQPLRDVYLHGTFENGVQSGGRIETVRLFVVIAGLVMLIACVNFMNLATARATRRSKEIGIRKVVGASRVALMAQVLSESVITALMALPLALLLVELVLPSLRTMTKSEVTIPFTQPLFWAATLGLVVLAGLLAGLYPALMLSGFNTASVLKGTVKSGRGALTFRRGLVVFEFAIAVAFISATIMVYRQMDFIKNKNIGLNRENIISLYVKVSKESFAAWKHELKGIEGVVAVGGSNDTPIDIGSNTSGLEWRGKQPKEVLSVSILRVDEDFMTTMGITLNSGRGFSRQFASDTTNFILNEAAVKAMRLAEPLGEQITWGDPFKGTVVGVMKDFHHNSMRNELEPLIFTLETGEIYTLFIRIAPANIASTLDAIHQSFEKFQPESPFNFTFLDDDFNDLYSTETMIGKLALYFSLVAVVVCCLGLFGLAAFTAESRTKEIGVRKVLGASVANVVALLTKDFLVLVGVAILISTPLSYWAAGKWLQYFAYRVELSWWVFASAGGAAVVIAFVTVASQAWRTAQANPVQSLRSE